MPAAKSAPIVTNALKSAHELILELRTCDDLVEMRAGIEKVALHIADARANALDAQEAIVALQRRLRTADVKRASALSFDATIDNYIRRPTKGGGFVYVERDNFENSPLFCANCFGKSVLSIFQPTVIEHMLRCPACGTATKD
jgi:hypothetical protein